jgi:hypothetical protein
MDCTNPTTGYGNIKSSLSYPYNFQVDVHPTIGQFLMTEDKIRRWTSGNQRKGDMTTVCIGSVPQILEERISITRRQQRTLHKEDNWLETAVWPPSLPSTTSALGEDEAESRHLGGDAFPWKQYQEKEEIRLRQLKTGALINIITLMRKNDNQSMFSLSKGSRLNVTHRVG